MKIRGLRGIFLLLAFLSLPALGCALLAGDPSEPPRNATIVVVAANTSLTPWLETAVADFNASNTKTAGGRTAFAKLTPIEAGQAVADFTAAPPDAALWIPDDSVWVNALAAQGNASFQADCAGVATSPLVIGIWRDVAESLGWPGLPLGWLDVGSLAGDPAAWVYYSGGEYGESLRLGHTHPGLSGSGASTLLAIVQAAESKTEAVTVADIQQPIVQASVGAFESAVAWFSSSTAALGETMRARGPGYLGAAVMYESTVVQYGGGEIVPIYPLEGTFVATHPACVNQTADPETRSAAVLFRDYLLSAAGQETAVAHGLRPINPAVSVGAPLDGSAGVDLAQPAIVFAPPSVDTLFAVQTLWQAARKPVNLVMLLDTSGSMRGAKMTGMQLAAEQFVAQMGAEDTLSLVEFHSYPDVLANSAQVGPNRAQLIELIRAMQPGGDTTLFDAIGEGARLIAESSSPQATNVMVILTDGVDTASTSYRFDDRLINVATANNTTIFTIAYGRDADQRLMAELATRGAGAYYQGDEASIAAIYEEMAAAFGGAAGVGR